MTGDLVDLAALGPGGDYRTRNREIIKDTAGVPVAESSVVPRLFVTRSIDAQRKLPATGRFAYVESWHDGYQKRVLAAEFDAFRPAMADGRRVLDLVAAHPATARHLCAKLVRRFIGEGASPQILAQVTAVWGGIDPETAHQQRDNQLATRLRPAVDRSAGSAGELGDAIDVHRRIAMRKQHRLSRIRDRGVQGSVAWTTSKT